MLDAATINNYDKEDIKGILGKPDKVSNDGTVFYYNLHPSNNNCLGEIEFANTGIATKTSLQNCN